MQRARETKEPDATVPAHHKKDQTFREALEPSAGGKQMIRSNRVWNFVAFALAFTVLVIAPGCGGGSRGCKSEPFTLSGGAPPRPLPIVGRITGEWQGEATNPYNPPPPELYSPFYTAPAPGPVGPMRLTINNDGTFTGMILDAGTGEVGTFTGRIENSLQSHDTPAFPDPNAKPKPEGDITGATLTFPTRTYGAYGGCSLGSDGRILGGWLRIGRGSYGDPGLEEFWASFVLNKQ
jgi:hypothetical protein